MSVLSPVLHTHKFKANFVPSRNLRSGQDRNFMHHSPPRRIAFDHSSIPVHQFVFLCEESSDTMPAIVPKDVSPKKPSSGSGGSSETQSGSRTPTNMDTRSITEVPEPPKRRRSNSLAIPISEPPPLVDSELWRGRQPSPLLGSDFSFREEFLISHYFDIWEKRQFSAIVKGGQIHPVGEVQELIGSNFALRHAVCALAALTLPRQSRPLSREILAHMGLALAILRKLLTNKIMDEGTLMAVIVLVDFEVCSSAVVNCSVRRGIVRIGKCISMLLCRFLLVCHFCNKNTKISLLWSSIFYDRSLSLILFPQHRCAGSQSCTFDISTI
jgi:Fungal specific transcription factor domain